MASIHSFKRIATHLKERKQIAIFRDAFSLTESDPPPSSPPPPPLYLPALHSRQLAQTPHFDRKVLFGDRSAAMISNHPVVNSTSDRSTITRSKKKKKIYDQQNQAPATATTSQWKSHSQQQVYFTKLHQALRQVHINSASPTRGRAVREAADKALAVTAKGRTRWSRAILMNRLKLKFMKKKNIKRQRTIVTGNSRWQKKHRVSILRLKTTKNLPAVQRKIRLLSRLVPGCRKEPLPVILEEATDYISALEMQVRAMTALADLLSASSSSCSSLQPPPAI